MPEIWRHSTQSVQKNEIRRRRAMTRERRNMPVIGLVPLYDDEKDSYWMLPGYMTGLEHEGAIPVMMPLTDQDAVICQLAETLDGFLLTGGHDIDPAVYGEQPLEACGEPCRMRDEMERKLLDTVLKLDKPVFGICRGIQYLNAYLGGTLYQDLPGQHPGVLEHHMKPPYDRPVHSVLIVQNSLLYRILGRDTLDVNSYHHQAVKKLAPGLEAMAYTQDGLVEAVSLPGRRFVVATQWHPEFSWRVDESSRKLLAAFVEACRQRNG